MTKSLSNFDFLPQVGKSFARWNRTLLLFWCQRKPFINSLKVTLCNRWPQQRTQLCVLLKTSDRHRQTVKKSLITVPLRCPFTSSETFSPHFRRKKEGKARAGQRKDRLAITGRSLSADPGRPQMAARRRAIWDISDAHTNFERKKPSENVLAET